MLSRMPVCNATKDEATRLMAVSNGTPDRLTLSRATRIDPVERVAACEGELIVKKVESKKLAVVFNEKEAFQGRSTSSFSSRKRPVSQAIVSFSFGMVHLLEKIKGKDVG